MDETKATNVNAVAGIAQSVWRLGYILNNQGVGI